MRIGIIGFSGFIGSRIATVCDSDPRVEGVALIGRNELDTITRIDSSNAASDLDLIVNCAEIPPTKYSERSLYLQNSLALNEKIIKFIGCQKNIPFVINLNSLWAYPDNANAITEDSFWSGPMNTSILWYSYPKRMLILQLESLADENRIKISNLTLGNVFGPNDKSDRVIPNVIKQISEGCKVIKLSGEGTEKRDFIHIQRQVERITECIHSSPKTVGRFLHIGGGNPLSVREATSCVAEALHFDGRIEFSGEQGSVVSPTDDRVMDMSLANIIFGWEIENRKYQVLDLLQRTAEDCIFEN